MKKRMKLLRNSLLKTDLSVKMQLKIALLLIIERRIKNFLLIPLQVSIIVLHLQRQIKKR